MNDAFWLATLREALRALAADAPAQLEYLRQLDVPGGVDELALQFDDAFVMVPQLVECGAVSQAAAARLSALDRLLDTMSGPGRPDIWSAEGLAQAAEWREVRRVAADALVSLPAADAIVRPHE